MYKRVDVPLDILHGTIKLTINELESLSHMLYALDLRGDTYENQQKFINEHGNINYRLACNMSKYGVASEILLLNDSTIVLI